MRVNTKIGDVFSVKLNENSKKYFQLIAYDLIQLNSDVIRAFKTVYPANENPELLEIVEGEVEFYAHCITKFGVKWGLWKKVGNIKNVGDTDSVLFRNTNDCTSNPDEDVVKISYDWYVWHINNKDFTDVGRLEGEN